MNRSVHTLGLLIALTACADRPAPPDSAMYVRQIQPLLAENGLLAERMLASASSVHDDKASPEMSADTWKRDIAPLAVHLHDQASRIDAPPEWSTSHQRLVEIWGERARGYSLIVTAIEGGDPDAWREGRALADQAKLDEETWFSVTNERLVPTGMTLDQYP